jgi:hypothetical protein
MVGKRFYLKPLLPLLTAQSRFYLLSLSQNVIRLFEATQCSIKEVALPGVPRSLTDALGTELTQPSLQFHTGTPGVGNGCRSAVFHGQGAGADEEKDELYRFLRLVDAGVMEVIGDRNAPLVIASVNYLLTMYRRVSQHQNLLKEGVSGNPDAMSNEELRRKAWPVIELLLKSQRRKWVKRFRDLETRDLASDRLETVIPAVHDGRVRVLFVALDRSSWGHFDLESRTLREERHHVPGTWDLLDLAVQQGLAHDATVFGERFEEMPRRSPIAAILRY